MKNQTNYVAGHLDKGQDGLLYSGGIEGEQAKRRYASLCKYLFLHFFSDVKVEASRNLEWLQYILDKGTDFEPGRLDAEISEAFRSPPGESHREMVSEISHRIYMLGSFGEEMPSKKK